MIYLDNRIETAEIG